VASVMKIFREIFSKDGWIRSIWPVHISYIQIVGFQCIGSIIHFFMSVFKANLKFWPFSMTGHCDFRRLSCRCCGSSTRKHNLRTRDNCQRPIFKGSYMNFNTTLHVEQFPEGFVASIVFKQRLRGSQYKWWIEGSSRSYILLKYFPNLDNDWISCLN
jgi:hypothetical protein